MLKPIRVTDARLNSPTDQTSQNKVKKETKSVQFTAQTLRMDEERKAKKPRIKSRPSTPADKALGGLQYKSASGWRLEDLQNCSVEIVQNVDPLEMIPEKFFDFEHEHLEQYADVRKDICRLSAEDAIIRKQITRSTVGCKPIFFALSRMLELQPTIREYKLAQKRSEKNTSQSTLSQRTSVAETSTKAITSPRAKPYGDLEGSSSSDRTMSNRIISGASTLEEDINSTGGERILFSKEVTTGTFCSNLFTHLRQSVWPDGEIILDWVEGRGETTLSWAETLTSVWKMGKERVEAQTDGGLFIDVPNPLVQTKLHERLVWTRSYYVLPLEAKRKTRVTGKDGSKKEIEITDPKSPVFAAQVFAEMLGMANHPEYFRHEDQEAFAMFIFHTSFQLYHCRFPKDYLKDIYETGFSSTNVKLECTPMYDFCEPEERGQWCDIFVALVEYLRSGESKVQWLSKSHPRNLIHKDREGEYAVEVLEDVDLVDSSQAPE